MGVQSDVAGGHAGMGVELEGPVEAGAARSCSTRRRSDTLRLGISGGETPPASLEWRLGVVWWGVVQVRCAVGFQPFPVKVAAAGPDRLRESPGARPSAPTTNLRWRMDELISRLPRAESTTMICLEGNLSPFRDRGGR